MAFDEKQLDDILSKYDDEEAVEEVSESEDDEQGELVDMSKTNNSTTITESQKQVDNFTRTGGNIIQERYASGEATMQDTVKDIAHVTVASKALNDKDENNKQFFQESVEQTHEALKESFKANVYQAQSQKIDAKRQKAEQFYIMFRPILEFDFSNLCKVQKVRINKPILKKKGEADKIDDKPQYEYIEQKPKSYADRSYGIPLMVLMLCLLTIPYCVVTIILSIFNAINQIFMQISNFGKTALILCSSMAGVTIIGLVVYVILLVIESSFGVKIFR